jgi:hypothetical protein
VQQPAVSQQVAPLRKPGTTVRPRALEWQNASVCSQVVEKVCQCPKICLAPTKVASKNFVFAKSVGISVRIYSEAGRAGQRNSADHFRHLTPFAVRHSNGSHGRNLVDYLVVYNIVLP